MTKQRVAGNAVIFLGALIIIYGIYIELFDHDELNLTNSSSVTNETITCLDVSEETIEWIELELIEGVALENVKAVKSNDFRSVYFISGFLVGGELSGDDIGTFTQQNITDTGLVYAISREAKRYSNWLEGDGERVTTQNHGYSESRNCISGS
ncbi:MAG: hypothetical protein U5K72_13080 [Balneolaceae bacterium]|nr:hypothetical protein [Balneolaceae bacterium]